uniref:Putative secreted protein n=1 Tax=Anopheles darlingi TaxID=43151 RepID=A0A2M4D3K3_ANODA
MFTASTLFTAAAQCRAVLPLLSAALMSASAVIRSSTIPSMASRAASISGVVPSCIRAFRLVARLRSRIWNTPIASAATAACSGVRPVLSWLFASAPASSNRLAASARAYRAARCSDVSPVLSIVAFSSAPCATSSEMIWAAESSVESISSPESSPPPPRTAATISGVIPQGPRTSTSRTSPS